MIKLADPTEPNMCRFALRLAQKRQPGRTYEEHLTTVWYNFMYHLPEAGIRSERELYEHFGVFHSERKR